MPHVYDDELDDPEDPDESDQDSDHGFNEQIDEAPCPYCRKPVYEHAEICPHCRSYISREEAPRRVPRWFWIGIILVLAVVLTWVVLNI